MKTAEDIQKKINSMHQLIDELHEWKNDLMERYSGLTEEENNDFHSDLGILVNQIAILEWVKEN